MKGYADSSMGAMFGMSLEQGNVNSIVVLFLEIRLSYNLYIAIRSCKSLNLPETLASTFSRQLVPVHSLQPARNSDDLRSISGIVVSVTTHTLLCW
jgi:hypothetical protein